MSITLTLGIIDSQGWKKTRGFALYSNFAFYLHEVLTATSQSFS